MFPFGAIIASMHMAWEAREEEAQRKSAGSYTQEQEERREKALKEAKELLDELIR